MVLCGLSISTHAESSQKRFHDKVVIVTGASKGIGKSIAESYAKEAAQVLLVARNKEALVEVQRTIVESGGRAECFEGDVSSSEAMDRMVRSALQAFGKVDILCHNAGVYPHKRLEEMTLADWNHVIDVNLTGTFLAVKACLPVMKAQGQGKIVVVSSISGPITALTGFSHYTASKAGVEGFVRTAAVELAKYRININCVAPGNILTEGLKETGDERIEKMVKAIPWGRLGLPQEVAYAVQFLSSEEADFITGQSLIIDGGQTLPESHLEEY